MSCPRTQRNVLPLPELEPGLLDPETSALTIRPPCLLFCNGSIENVVFYFYRRLAEDFDVDSFNAALLVSFIPVLWLLFFSETQWIGLVSNA